MAGAAFARESRSVIERERRAEFAAEYGRAWPDLFRYAFVLTRHREDAEDVAAEAFRRALEAAAEGRAPTDEIRPWLSSKADAALASSLASMALRACLGADGLC